MDISTRRFRGSDGERFSVLVDEQGMPLFYPTLFITWTLRASSHAANSITNALNALKALCAWEASRGMDLESAFTQGVLLDHNQVRDLCDFLQRSLESEQPAKVTPIRHKPKVVGTTVHYFRISTAAQYLQFLAHRVAPHIADEVVNKMFETIKEHRPSKPNKSSTDRDEIHLSDEAIHAIEAALKPGSPDNPANDGEVQLRNALMFFLLKLTGMRRGELLNLRISDINFADNTLAVVRRPDSSLDTRKHQPTAKTRSRRIRIAPALVERIANYVKDVRRNVPGARRHDYLFVTHKAGPTQGAPLSIGAFSKWMGQISDIAENAGFHAHALRHNWNYQFSRLAEEKGMSSEEEEKIRSYWMGWSETSGTAGTYNRRHTKEKAQQAGLELQERYVKPNQESE
ncbi:site-specific integrase [Salmonella enterica]|uniref:tyrosine-type recombinase/integrase n=1 Tax=Salmonella enterica TaxID=28901 RepID=UPI003464E81F